MQDVQFIEFFAGSAALTQKMRQAGLKSVRCDIEYFKCMGQMRGGKQRSNYMDILTPSGFMQLG